MTPVIKTVELSDTVKLPYIEQGNPTGVPVLLLHGITDSWYSFERILPFLPESWHVFALTQRGHGDASRPATGYGSHDFAADLGAFIDALQLSPSVIVGHSMGAFIAQRFAIDYPRRTLGLVLVGSRTTWRGHPDLVELWNKVVSTRTDAMDPDFVRAFQESTLAQPTPPEFLATVVQESLKMPARVWRAAIHECLLEADFSEELGKIEAPTLIVCGDRDTLARSGQEALTEAIAGARLVTYPAAGHGLHWEEPARFATDLTAFVEHLIS